MVLFTAGVKSIRQKGLRPARTHRLVKEQIRMDGINLFLDWHRYKICHLTSLYHRQTACRIGFYEIDISSTDWESLLRLVLHGNVILSERIVAAWRKHDNNLSLAMNFNEFKENFAFIERPLEYAISRGHNKIMMKNWRKTMINTIMKGQFNEVWINVMRKHNLAEIINFTHVVREEKPEFVKNFFHLKNIVRLFLCFAGISPGNIQRL